MFNLYTVTLRFQFPAWDEKDGITYQVSAMTKSDAVKAAKREAEYDGHVPATGKGRCAFKAEQITAP